MNKEINLEKDPNNQGPDFEKLLYMNYLVHKPVLTMDECADYTDLSKHYLYKLTHNRQIPHFKPNVNKFYFKREELDAWLLSTKVDTIQSEEVAAKLYAKKLNKSIRGS